MEGKTKENIKIVEASKQNSDENEQIRTKKDGIQDSEFACSCMKIEKYHTSIEQKLEMLNFMINHPGLIFTGPNPKYENQWYILVEVLNSLKVKAEKPIEMWETIWNDWMTNLKRGKNGPKNIHQIIQLLKKCKKVIENYKDRRNLLNSIAYNNSNFTSEELKFLTSKLLLKNDEFETMIRHLEYFERKESNASASIENRKQAIINLTNEVQMIQKKIEMNKILLELKQKDLKEWVTEKENFVHTLRKQICTLDF